MIYRKLRATYSNGYANHMPEFKKAFPELSGIDNEELASRFSRLKMGFYYEEKKPVSTWVRITLPLALIVIFIMIISLPVNFMITGQWGYSLGKKNLLINWFRSLRLNV